MKSDLYMLHSKLSVLFISGDIDAQSICYQLSYFQRIIPVRRLPDHSQNELKGVG